jgi:lysophospholipase L1-like esterase
MIAKIAQKHNTEILLLTEFINPSSIQPFGTNTDEIDIKTVFSEYRTIQKTISENHPHVHYIDTWDLLPKFLNEDLFIDSNHLNQQGNQRIADIISPTIEQLLQKKPL